MNNETAIKILSKRNYMCGECPFSGPDCKGCRLAEALDLAIGALSTPEVPNNMTLIPTAVLDDLTKTTRELGEWENKGIAIRCSICGAMYSVAFYEICYDHLEFHYCPNCGARMTNGGGK